MAKQSKVAHKGRSPRRLKLKAMKSAEPVDKDASAKFADAVARFFAYTIQGLIERGELSIVDGKVVTTHREQDLSENAQQESKSQSRSKQ